MRRFLSSFSVGALLAACTSTPPASGPAPVAGSPQFNIGDRASDQGFDRLPPAILRQMLDPARSTGYPQLAWPTQEVTVAFLGGSQQLREIIEATANEWIRPESRLRLSFRRSNGQFRTWSDRDGSPAADIRIAFYTDAQRGGYWSAVGTLARRVNANAPTMNLGDLPARLAGATVGGITWRSTYSHTVILHEFGHAFGLNHEHFHPECQRDIRMDQAVATVAAEQRWDPSVARFNLDASYYASQLAAGGVVGPPAISRNIDRESVMLYSLNPSFLISEGNSVCLSQQPFATQLSTGDRNYFAAVYHGR